MTTMTEQEYIDVMRGAGEWEFVRDTLIAGKMYEWWRNRRTLRMRLAPSMLRDPEFVERLRTIVDEEAFARIAGVEEFGEQPAGGEAHSPA